MFIDKENKQLEKQWFPKLMESKSVSSLKFRTQSILTHFLSSGNQQSANKAMKEENKEITRWTHAQAQAMLQTSFRILSSYSFITTEPIIEKLIQVVTILSKNELLNHWNLPPYFNHFQTKQPSN